MLSAEYIKGKYDAIVQAHPGFAPLTTVRKEYLEAAFQTIDTDYHLSLTKAAMIMAWWY